MADFRWETKLSPQSSIRKGQYGKGFLEHDIAALPGVQGYLDQVLFEAKVRAEEDLEQHHLNALRNAGKEEGGLDLAAPSKGHSFIDTISGDIDRFLCLNDTRGQGAAAAIEYGHAAYRVETPDGRIYEVGASEGTFVLHNAVKLNPKGGKTRLKRIKSKRSKQRRQLPTSLIGG